MAADRSSGHRCRREPRAVALGMAVVLAHALGGCTYEDREPGLFDQGRQPSTLPAPSSFSSPARSPLPVANPALPVVGEAVWTSADGLQIQVRLAVHAVRRVDGATVLDWSVTPLRGPNLRLGDTVPTGFDLGLSRPPDDVPYALLIDQANRAYRPLGRAPGAPHCLCTPPATSQRAARIGVTTLLQVSFPELPDAVRVVDVSLGTVPRFWRVPVTPIGQVPLPRKPIDLARPAPARALGARSPMFRFGADDQVFRIRALRVVASRSFTTLEWAIVSVTGGGGVASASLPPFAGRDAVPQSVGNPVVASGPRLRTGVTVLAPLAISSASDRDKPTECLCTDLQGWPTALRRPDKEATVVTSFPPLPAGTRRVQIILDGLPALELPVSEAPDASRQVAGTARFDPAFWRFDPASPPTGWVPAQWPTPLPDRRQVTTFDADAEFIVR